MTGIFVSSSIVHTKKKRERNWPRANREWTSEWKGRESTGAASSGSLVQKVGESTCCDCTVEEVGSSSSLRWSKTGVAPSPFSSFSLPHSLSLFSSFLFIFSLPPKIHTFPLFFLLFLSSLVALFNRRIPRSFFDSELILVLGLWSPTNTSTLPHHSYVVATTHNNHHLSFGRCSLFHSSIWHSFSSLSSTVFLFLQFFFLFDISFLFGFPSYWTHRLLCFRWQVYSSFIRSFLIFSANENSYVRFSRSIFLKETD